MGHPLQWVRGVGSGILCLLDLALMFLRPVPHSFRGAVKCWEAYKVFDLSEASRGRHDDTLLANLRNNLIAVILVVVALAGCADEEQAAECFPSGEEPPSVYRSQDGNTWTGQSAIDAWEEENPPVPSEFCSAEFMANLPVLEEDLFAPMDTSDPAQLIRMFVHNVNCTSGAPHPHLQRLCVRALTGDEGNSIGQVLMELADNWFRFRISDPDTESIAYRVDVIDSSVQLDRPIHEHESVSFVVVQTQHDPIGDEQVSSDVELTFSRSDLFFDPVEADEFHRVRRTNFTEHRNVWVLSGFREVE